MKNIIIFLICVVFLVSGRLVADPIVYVHIQADVNLIRCAYNASILLGVPIEVDSTIHGERIIDNFVWIESIKRDSTTYVIITEDDMHKYNTNQSGAVDIADLVYIVSFIFGGRN